MWFCSSKAIKWVSDSSEKCIASLFEINEGYMENEWRLNQIWRTPEEQFSARKYIINIKWFQLSSDTLRGISTVQIALGVNFYLAFASSNLYISKTQWTPIFISKVLVTGLGTPMDIIALFFKIPLRYLQVLELDVVIAKRLSEINMIKNFQLSVINVFEMFDHKWIFDDECLLILFTKWCSVI